MSKLSFDQLTNLFLILSVEGIGPGKIRNLLEKFQSIENILGADEQSLINVIGININLARRIKKRSTQREQVEKYTEEELRKLEKLGGIRCIRCMRRKHCRNS